MLLAVTGMSLNTLHIDGTFALLYKPSNSQLLIPFTGKKNILSRPLYQDFYSNGNIIWLNLKMYFIKKLHLLKACCSKKRELIQINANDTNIKHLENERF